MKLSVKQKKFADEYIISGNATQSAIKAGYSQKTANRIASQNLTKVDIKNYIAERTRKSETQKTMDIQEALEIHASIARGEIQKGSTKQFDKLKGEVIKDVEYEFTPNIEERQKSLEHILKVNGAFVDKTEMIGDISFTVVRDYGDEEED